MEQQKDIRDRVFEKLQRTHDALKQANQRIEELERRLGKRPLPSSPSPSHWLPKRNGSSVAVGKRKRSNPRNAEDGAVISHDAVV